ncbi:hypothetical protein HanPSC8_Chr16g0719241 [Helianthus annuus]|nr:hypothetical protein HanPSC8_Chr16g0719241 [Helianthus annuus]
MISKNQRTLILIYPFDFLPQKEKQTHRNTININTNFRSNVYNDKFEVNHFVKLIMKEFIMKLTICIASCFIP